LSTWSFCKNIDKVVPACSAAVFALPSLDLSCKIIHLVNPSIHPSTNQSINQPSIFFQSINQSINPSSNHQSFINQSINHQSINQPSIVYQSINQSINHSINQSDSPTSYYRHSITYPFIIFTCQRVRLFQSIINSTLISTLLLIATLILQCSNMMNR